MAEKQVVFEAKSDIVLTSFAVEVQIHETFVDRVSTSCHLLRVLHVVLLPVTEFIVRACSF